jgi:hypothetical protein
MLGSGPYSRRLMSNRVSTKAVWGIRLDTVVSSAAIAERCLVTDAYAVSIDGKNFLKIGAYIFFGFVMLNFGPATVPRREST